MVKRKIAEVSPAASVELRNIEHRGSNEATWSI